MRALTVASLVFGLAFSAASIATAAEVKKATFLKQAPKALGSRMSTVTSYELRKPDGSGIIKNCRGSCAGSSTTLHWQCEVDANAIGVLCSMKCRPPPVEGLCLPL